MKEGTCKWITIASLLLVLSVTLYAAPTVTVLTDKASYRAGETIELSLGGENHDEPLSVDVYIGLIGRDGALYTLGEAGWGAYLEPWMADLFVPNPFYMAPVAFQWFDVPCAMPPISEVGGYSFAAGLTQPGTMDFVAEISFAPFTINPPELHIYVSAQTGNDANDGSQDSPFKTITHALSAVSGSEARPVTIHVAAGTYAKSTNGETFPLNMKSWVSLSGVGPETTALDAEDDADHLIFCSNVDKLTIEGFTITNGYAWSGTGGMGGGIFCTRSSPTIRGNVISGNQAKYGAGIYCGKGSSPAIENNSISENTASYSYGGGIYCDDTGSAAIRNNLIINNSAYLGGALYYYAQSPPTIENNTITGNRAKYGAGIYCVEASRSAAGLAADCSAQAVRTGTVGFPERTFDVSDCIVWGNSASSRYTYDDDGLYRDLYCCSAVYSCIEQEEKGEGNIHDDPMFVSGIFGPYYLDPQSPCVDAGSRSAVEAGLADRTTQVDQTPDTGTVDIGYHDRIPATQRPVAHIDSISPNPAVQGVDTVEFRGHGTDDRAITSYEWESNLEGLLSNQQVFSIPVAPHLRVGTHTISLTVWDDEDQWSEQPAVAALTILPNPRDKVLVDAEAGDDSNDGSEMGPFKTITFALACVHGTEDKPVIIHVAAGKYAASTSGETFPLVMKSWVSIIGEGPDLTVLDAELVADHVVIYCERANDLIIEGLTVTGGNAYYSNGGGIYCNQSSLIIRNNVISGNSGYEEGGGIYCNRSSAMVQDNTITDNSAHYGGGVFCQDSSPTISGNTITGNSTSYRNGGGICCYNSSPTIEDNSITGNSAYFIGGGIYCEGGSPIIQGNTIEGNSADSYSSGGGIDCYKSSPTIRSNSLIGNSAGYGAGIDCAESSPTIENNTIAGNSADCYGGGIYGYGSATIQGNTIEYNSAAYTGGGIYYGGYDSSIGIKNNTIQGNSAGSGGGICCSQGSPTIENNVITGNRVEGEYGAGGAICIADWCSPAIVNNTVTGNSASWGGGGICCGESSPTILNNAITGNSAVLYGGGIYFGESTPTVRNNTVLGNSAGRGGGIYCYETSPSIIDCIIWGNGDDLCRCSATYCCIEDDDAGTGNIHDDPMFVTGALAEFYLHPESPCIDAGSRSAEEAGLAGRTTQADGTPDAGAVDMGYHYPILQTPTDTGEDR